MNVLVKIFFVFIDLCIKYLGVKILSHRVDVFLTLLEMAKILKAGCKI